MARYLIGELFDAEQIKQKTAFHNMKAKDDKGHMRWQGAFTGGFTAGYKNTCGSKDGWAPSTFHSSRDKRSDMKKQQIHQFMDNDDVGKSKLSQNIQIQDNFKSDNKLIKIGLDQSIGRQMLSKLRKLKAKQQQPENEQDVKKLFQKYGKIQQKQLSTMQYHFVDKQDYSTLGYSHFNNEIEDPFITNYTETFPQPLNDKFQQQTQQQKRKKKQDNKVYFDFTRPLQEDGDNNDYLKQIVDVSDEPKKKKKLALNNYRLDQLFRRQQRVKENQKVSKYPKVPEDYDPYKRMRQYKQAQGIRKANQDKQTHKLSIDQRSKILGERNPLTFIKQQEYVKGQNQQLSGNFEMEYFLMDPDKQKRYQQYVLEQQGKFLASDNLGGLQWQKQEQQRQQFQKIYKKSLQKGNTARNALMQAQKKKPKTKQPVSIVGKADRVKKQWHPQKLLCKRFNVLMPHKNK